MNDLVTGSVLAQDGVVQVSPEGVCRIDMVVDDALIVPEVLAYPAGAERDRYVLTARACAQAGAGQARRGRDPGRERPAARHTGRSARQPPAQRPGPGRGDIA